MICNRKFYFLTLGSIVLIFFINIRAYAMEVSDKFSIGGVISGVYQYQDLNDTTNFKNTGRGAIIVQPEFSFTPSEKNEIFIKFGFAAGNALNDGTSPFALTPWAADVEMDVKNINGRSRDYLLNAWYKHILQFGEGFKLGLSGGIIDATDYIDENAYSSDEFTQFMNKALVNAPNVFLPSYDIGIAVEWDYGNLGINGVVMNLGNNDQGRSTNYFGSQLSYQLETGLGQGNYRVIYNRSSEDFDNPAENKLEAKKILMISFDQKLGDILGAWIRFGWQDDRAKINYKNLYSGGLNVDGGLWHREADNIGLGYAILDCGNQDIDTSEIFEVYYRLAFNDYIACSFDLQYLKDDMKTGDSPRGFVYGVRMTAEF